MEPNGRMPFGSRYQIGSSAVIVDTLDSCFAAADNGH
jgi:hypothetical protein